METRDIREIVKDNTVRELRIISEQLLAREKIARRFCFWSLTVIIIAAIIGAIYTKL